MSSSSEDASATSSAAPALKPLTIADVGIASIINGYFLAVSLVDLSADTWALRDWDERSSFLSSYYRFRHDGPILSSIIGVLVLLLPAVLYTLVAEDVLGLWRRPIHRLRHIIGTVGLAALIAIITFTILWVRPDELAIVAGGTLSSAATRLYYDHLWVVVVNAAAMLLPFFKFTAAAAAMEPDAQQGTSLEFEAGAAVRAAGAPGAPIAAAGRRRSGAPP